MAGTIFFPSGARWTARSSVCALALEALIPMISDLETHELVVTLNEGNVGMLDVEDMPPRGRTEEPRCCRFLRTGGIGNPRRR